MQVKATKPDSNHCFLVMDVSPFDEFVCEFFFVVSSPAQRADGLSWRGRDPRSLSLLLGTYLSDEIAGNAERAVSKRQRQCGQPSRRRPEYDLRARARVVFGVVAHALEHLLVA